MTTETTIDPLQHTRTRFTYGFATVADLTACEVKRTAKGKITLKDLEIDGIPVQASRRFWRSFFSRFGIAENVFRYFTAEEVFTRIHQQNNDDAFRFCIAETSMENSVIGRQLLAVTNPNRPVIRHNEILELLEQHGGQDVRYHDGLVTSTHMPQGRTGESEVGGDQFRDRFCLETPIDGYGHPRLFLSMLRLICSNGMIGYSRAFRSDIPIGKKMNHCITRALHTFDNDDGYAALRQRFESAQNSWASVHECLQFGALLDKLSREGELMQLGLLGKFRGVAGNLGELYGLANIEALSDRRRRLLPSRARVYDVINFASEVATHHAKVGGANRIQAFLGSLISDEYDLEGTADGAPEFDDFFIDRSDAIVRQSLN